MALGLLAAASCLASGCATTGEVRGRLLVPGATGGRAADAVVYAVPDDPGRAPPAGAALAPAGRQRPRPERKEVTLTARGFRPRVLPVVVGSTVLFRNRDRVYHKLFSISPACRFTLAGCAPGRASAVEFDTVGAVSVYCELDPAASGCVFVLPDRRYAQPRADGRFALPRLEPGAYTVRVWHPALGETSRRVKVTAGGRIDLELEL
jgi:plastocyanin